MQRATGISVCVIAVNKSHEFLLKVRRLSSFFDDNAYAFTSTRRNFFHDDARDSTSTTSQRFFHDIGHYFGPKTLRTQDISALCVWCRSVSHFCVGAEVALKCTRHLWPRIKICFERVKNVEPLYIRYSNGTKVLGKRLTKVVWRVSSHALSATNIRDLEAEECKQLQWAEVRRRMRR